eukprot:CAMPEP_0184555600 /NCGR_PEP_ID=MMETSP0199_2-20130426/37867_1 /TAXON_ID=1112570 /ORGANISM="Thraustochytrium sp., Strain LLF1b" /LENGTH=272 /DNA_ID=CAMNT_0026951967 /DNA_START=8 /DNA_END=826 /DNA_ORIENTATION=+
MDEVLRVSDEFFFTPYVYPESWREDDMWRQALSLYLITFFGGYSLYLTSAWVSYLFVWDHALKVHPKYLPNQIQREIMCSTKGIPFMILLQLPWVLGEVRGHSKLYDRLDEHTLSYTLFSLACYLMFNDCLIYFIHRALHHPLLYKRIHKEHHKWIIPTPFASHAMTPLDGVMQSLPYMWFPYLMPLNKWIHLTSFVAVNFWTVFIHSFVKDVPKWLEPILNGAAHHTDHHLYFQYNHGQYFTLWDRIGGTYRNPSTYEGKGPDQVVHKKSD